MALINIAGLAETLSLVLGESPRRAFLVECVLGRVENLRALSEVGWL